jgi:protein CpxP
MKKILMVCCFLLGISAVSFAQGGGGRRTPEEQAKNLQTQLKLTDDQTAKITAIYQTQAKSMDSVRTASNGDRQAMMQAMRPMREATNTKVKALLTAEQVTAFDKMQAEMRSRMGGGGGQGGGNTPPPNEK